MRENHQDTVNHNSITTETKLWLPPSYTNSKTPTPLTPPTPKRRGSNWGFTNKSFWEWLLLIGTLLAAFGAIAIPAAIAWFSYQQNQTNQQIAIDQQQETVLQNYFDRLSDLLLNDKLQQSKPGDEIRKIAQARTLTALRSVNPERKVSILLFLQESNLISGKNTIISLSNADLSGIELSFVIRENPVGTSLSLQSSSFDLSNADLRNADLHGSDLSFVNLSGANLDGANLRDVTLINAYIVGTQLSGAALTNANLQAAILANADLVGSTISQDQLDQAIICKNVALPIGLTCHQ